MTALSHRLRPSSEPSETRPDATPASDLRDQLVVAAVLTALTLGFLASVAVVGGLLDEPFEVFTKEPVEQFDGAESYIGFVAHVNWFLWVVGGSVAACGAVLLIRLRPRDRTARFLLVATGFTALLLLDDFALLHDRLLPKAGVHEDTLYAVYAVTLVVLLARYHEEFRAGGIVLALAAGGCWAVSVGTDVLQDHTTLHALEDGAKLVGTALWAAFLVRAGTRAMFAAAAADQLDRRQT